LILFAAVLGCSIVLPYGVLLRTAFVRNWSAPLELANLSLEHLALCVFRIQPDAAGN